MMVLKAPYLLDFRHKKRRPWTSLEPGTFEPVLQVLAFAVISEIFKAKGYMWGYTAHAAGLVSCSFMLGLITRMSLNSKLRK